MLGIVIVAITGGGAAPLTSAVVPMAVTHDIVHSFNVVDAVPVKTDEGGESHRVRHWHRQAPRCGIKKEAGAPWPLDDVVILAAISVRGVQKYDCVLPQPAYRSGRFAASL